MKSTRFIMKNPPTPYLNPPTLTPLPQPPYLTSTPLPVLQPPYLNPPIFKLSYLNIATSPQPPYFNPPTPLPKSKCHHLKIFCHNPKMSTPLPQANPTSTPLTWKYHCLQQSMLQKPLYLATPLNEPPISP